ncbi:putative duf408 domain protein [Erysiphe necator]|uniref:RNA polymerase II subunit B1 CTD phosphatase RPAP2 homolog n=1 Tax=Uncinula necator TaxID=52586 RepID=A0A0B1P4L2_UNCNE|nr:putative duf408 domain protein [Erysiphe necator]
MNNEKHIKSILKKTNNFTVEKKDRNREIAIHHANIIQQRKNFELEILFSIETLIDYPLAPPPADASNPSPIDISKFRQLVQSFQPSDYDSLIEERNINDRCGYALCPNRRHKEVGGGKYRLQGTSGKAKYFRVVEKEALEKWCSNTCALRAMYVKIQLDQLPAWDRGIIKEETYVDLLVGPTAKELNVHNSSSNTSSISDQSTIADDFHCLTLESRDNILESKIGPALIDIKDKQVKKLAQHPQFFGNTDDNTLHLNLEGHKTNFKFG